MSIKSKGTIKKSDVSIDKYVKDILANFRATRGVTWINQNLRLEDKEGLKYAYLKLRVIKSRIEK